MLAHAETKPIVAVCCSRAPASHVSAVRARGAHIHEVPCAGNLHSSVVELLIRSGSPGVIACTCPPRDCSAREGPKWLRERLFNEREAELQPRVDRRRVRIAIMAPGDLPGTLSAFDSFAADLASLGRPAPEPSMDVDLVCEPVPMEEAAQ